MRALVRTFVYANGWIALGAAAANLQSLVVLGAEGAVLWRIPLFCFAATLFTYNFQRLVKLRNVAGYTDGSRNQWVHDHRKVLGGLTVFAFLLTAGMATLLHPASLLMLAATGGIAVAYAVRFLPSGDRLLALRDLPHIKLYLIGVVWAVATVALPLSELGEDLLSRRSALLLFERFAFIVALSIPFDIRDMHLDDPQMKTLPHRRGVGASLAIAVLWLGAASATAVALKLTDALYSNVTLMALLAAFAVTAVLVLRTRAIHRQGQPNEWHYAFWLDGMIVLQLCFVLIGGWF